MGEKIWNHVAYVTGKANEIIKNSSGVLAYD
jgi:hypothetical protein